MPKYKVEVPRTYKETWFVKAENESEAISKAENENGEYGGRDWAPAGATRVEVEQVEP